MYKRLISAALIYLFLVGCSLGKLTKEESHTKALEFAKEYVELNNIETPDNEIIINQSKELKDGWVVFLDYEKNSIDPLESFPLVWVSISNDRSIKEYNFTAWGGENKIIE